MEQSMVEVSMTGTYVIVNTIRISDIVKSAIKLPVTLFVERKLTLSLMRLLGA